jgi:hypothetical protein
MITFLEPKVLHEPGHWLLEASCLILGEIDPVSPPDYSLNNAVFHIFVTLFDLVVKRSAGFCCFVLSSKPLTVLAPFGRNQYAPINDYGSRFPPSFPPSQLLLAMSYFSCILSLMWWRNVTLSSKSNLMPR